MATPTPEPIALIGYGCRFPGKATSPSRLWELLKNPRDLLTTIPSNRFNTDGFYAPDRMRHGSTNVRQAYLLEGEYRHYDAQFFGTKPVEAHAMDPQHRHLLEVVYEAVESAGLSIASLEGSDTSVYVGLMCEDYSLHLRRDAEAIPTYLGTGTANSLLSNRVSYFFDWHGESMTIDTACSSSLVAVNHAVQALRSGRCHIAIAAGSNLIMAPEQFIAESKLNMLSPGGRSRMWDCKADGYARGEGVAAVVLKTLSAALADGDEIDCLIREVGVNQDGRTSGITMPSAEAQRKLIVDTYRRVNLDPCHDRPQFFEAHGTGTPTGDPLEAEAISRAFFPSNQTNSKREEGSTLYVGSIKTVIGHTEGTAGIAGLLKAALALKHGFIPPNLLFDELNPSIAPFYTNLQILTKGIPWPNVPSGKKALASVNSFGFGGTNAHAILERFSPPRDETGISGHTPALRPVAPFLFSAASESALRNMLKDYLSSLKSASGQSMDLASINYTLHSRRSALPVKATFAASSMNTLLDQIQAALESDSNVGIRTTYSSSSRRKVLGIFTGQGAQWPGMGRALALESSFVRRRLRDFDIELQNGLPVADRPKWSLEREMTTDAASSQVDKTEYSQPLCTALQLVLVDLLYSAGVRFDVVIGHSSGEIAACYAAGYIRWEDAIKIAYYRGFHVSKSRRGENIPVVGAMLAVGTTKEDAEELCNMPEFKGRVSLAASNSPSSITLSGDADAVAELGAIFQDEKRFARPLRVDQAYHSHHMQPHASPYRKSLHLSNIEPCSKENRSNRPVWISSVHPDVEPGVRFELSADYWVENLVQPVLFSQAVTRAIKEYGQFDLGIEVGPHPALKGPTLQTVESITGSKIPYTGTTKRNADDIEALGMALGSIWTHIGPTGVKMSAFEDVIRGVDTNRKGRLAKNLPPYPWDHEQIYWYESRVARVFRTRPFPIHPLLGSRQLSGPEEFQWRNFLQIRELPWLSGHKIQQQILFPAAGYIVAALEAVLLMVEGSSVGVIELSDLTIPNAIAFPDENATVETVITLSRSSSTPDQGRITVDFTFHAPPRPDSDTLSLACSGRIDVILGNSKYISNMALSSDATLSLENPVNIETDYFYSILTSLGYGYTDSFRALSELERSSNESKALLDAPGRKTHGFLIHPATLDNCFQAIMLAIGYPGDGIFCRLHVPTRIRHISVDARKCQQHLESESQLQALALARQHEGMTFDGDVHLLAADGKDVLVRVEGLEVTPVSASSDPPHILSSFTWKTAAPQGNLAPITIAADPALHRLILASQQACLYYMQLAKKDIANIGLEQAPAHYKHFASYIEYILDRVAAGTQAFTKPEWLQTSQAEMEVLLNQYSDNIVIRTIRTVGENLAAAIRGELDMLEPLMCDGLLDEFYAKSTGMAEGSESLAALVRQISHRYPRMNILEIGAGTGGATKSILKNDLRFGSYTFTDISMGFFEKARTTFSSFNDSMSYKILDISSDIVKQGFAPHSYDVIVASCVLHATNSLDVTLQNCYTLLKPGGWLLMLEQTDHHGPLRAGFIFGCLPGWWLGIDDDRQLSPSVTSARWHRHFKAAGFGDISTITSPGVNECINPNFVICAQASDYRIDFLRQPLLRPGDQIALENLVLVGGSKPATDSLAEDVLNLLSPWHKGSVSRRRSLAEVSEVPLPPRSCVLNIVDLDQPTFENMNQSTLDGLKSTLEHSSILLWITYGSRYTNPYANMSVGFGRAARLEFSHIRLQFLDLDPGRPLSADMIASAFLRLNALEKYTSDVDQPPMLWSIENELAQDDVSEDCEKRSGDDQLLIPRLYRMIDAYDRLHSNSRLTSLSTAGLNGREIFTVKVASSRYTVYQSLDTARFAELDSQSREIESYISLMSPLRITPGVYGYLVFGKCLSSEETLVALSFAQSSVVRTSIFAKVPPLTEPDHLDSFLAHIVASLFFDTLDSHLPGPVLIHEPDPALADILRYHAARYDRKLFFTTSDGTKQNDWIFIHLLASDRSTLAALPRSVAYFVDFSQDGSKAKLVGSRLNTLLPPCIERIKLFDSFFGNMRTQPSDALSKIISQKLSQAVKTTLNAHKELPVFSLTKRVSIDNLHSISPEPNELRVLDWHTERGKEIPVTLQAADSQNLFRSDKTYVLFGYSSDLAQNMCTWMAEHGLRHVVLTSRSPNVSPSWLQRMHNLGVHVRVERNDITNKAQVQTLIENLRRTMPEIRGLVSGAMVLEDAGIPSLTMDLVEKQLRPKVQGTVHLHEAFKQQSLDFFICLSSMTAQFGNRGQSVYAAGNLFMSALMAQRRRSGLAGSVIHIGPVMGAGFLARRPLKYALQIRKRSGFDGVAERHLHQAFAEAMFIGHPQSPSEANGEIAIGHRHPVFEEGLREQWYESPLFQHYVLPEPKTTANDNTETSTRQSIEHQLLAVKTRDQMLEVLGRELAAKIRVILQLSTSSNDTDILRQGAFELGIDSLVAIELRSWILREIHADLPLFKILGSSALSDVVELAAELLPDELVPNIKSSNNTAEKKARETSTELQIEQLR